MPAKLEPLNLRITGNSSGLSAALGRSQKEIGGFANRLTGHAKDIRRSWDKMSGAMTNPVFLGSLAALTAGAIGARKAVDAVAAGFDRLDSEWKGIDEAAKAAKKLGLEFQALAGIRLAFGEGSGIEAQKVESGLARMQAALFEASQGAGRAKKALDAMGLDAGKLLQEGPQKALLDISAAIQGMQNPSDQLLATLSLFGEEGAAFVSTLRGGPAAIQEAMSFQAKWLDMTAGQVALIETLNDRMARTGIIVDGIAKQFAAELAPLALVLTDRVINLTYATNSWKESIQIAVEGWALGAGIAFDMLEAITDSIRSVNAAVQGDIEKANQLAMEAIRFDTGDKLIADMRRIRQEFEANAPKPEDLNFDANLRMLQSNELNLDGPNSMLEKMDAAAKAATDSIDKWQRAADSFRQKLATPQQQFDANLQELEQAFLKGGLELELFQRGIAEQVARLNESLLKPREVPQLPPALLKGSEEAEELIRRSNFQAGEQQRLEKIQEQIKKQVEDFAAPAVLEMALRNRMPAGPGPVEIPRIGAKPSDPMRDKSHSGSKLDVAAEKLKAAAAKLEEAKQSEPKDDTAQVLSQIHSEIQESNTLLRNIKDKPEPQPLKL